MELPFPLLGTPSRCSRLSGQRRGGEGAGQDPPLFTSHPAPRRPHAQVNSVYLLFISNTGREPIYRRRLALSTSPRARDKSREEEEVDDEDAEQETRAIGQGRATYPVCPASPHHRLLLDQPQRLPRRLSYGDSGGSELRGGASWAGRLTSRGVQRRPEREPSGKEAERRTSSLGLHISKQGRHGSGIC